MTADGNLANTLYMFASYVQAAVESGLTDGLLDRCSEVQDLALVYLTDEFREAA